MIIPLILLYGFGLSFFIWGFSSWKVKRLVENTPTSKVRSIAMGPVELTGSVRPSGEGTIIAPLSQRKCVYYKYQVQEYRKSGKHSSWVTVMRGSQGKYFFLKDTTGEVLVDTTGAQIDIPHSYKINSGTFKSPPKEIVEFLNTHGRNHKSLFGFRKTMMFTEWALIPNEKVYIFGTAADNPYTKDGTAQKNEDDIMIQKGKTIFYISNKNEKKIIKSFLGKIWMGFVVGIILLTAGTFLLIITLRGLI